ncbi:MAG: hypothetical protein PCFJNLEI_03832 [Verrucomicrobiae bacterium]|nr:hypothetical protein [Verrucomicrobiae bacterium]
MTSSKLSALATIRQRQLYLLTATGAPPSASPILAPIIANVDAVADTILARQIWDPTSPEHGNVHGQPLTHAQFTFGTHYFGDVRRIITAWRCPFSRHYQKPAVLERCIAALRFGERYVRPDQPRDGSWYMWDLGFPSSLSIQLLLLGDSLPADLRQLILEDLAHMPSKVFTLDRERGIIRPPVQSGSNNLEALSVGFLRGLVLDDPQWLDTVMTQVPIAMGPATGSEGLQPDWSYHFHGYGVNAGYGLHCLSAQAQWLYLTHGTPWQLPDQLRELHVNMVREFFARDFWRGRVAPYSVDRGIAGPGGLYCRSFLTTILLGLHTDLPAADKAVFAAAAADYLQGLDPDGKPLQYSESDTPSEVSLLPGLLLAGIPQPIQADPAIIGGMRYYPHSEYLLVRQSNWFAAVRMSSGMTSTWKSMLGSHLHGSSGAEFSIAFMTDGREFDHTTIPTMNWKRLMGVTRCDAIEPPPEGYGQSAFCGGLAGDDFAVLGLQYLLAPAGQDTLRANKSLFATPDALILLGSLIRCDSDEPVVTTLFHAPLLDDNLTSREVKAGETLRIRNVSIQLLCDAQLIVETRRGSYGNLNRKERAPDDPAKRAAWYHEYERRWVYLIVNHGVQPANGRYGAIITAGQPAEYKILHNDNHHRVDLGQTGGEVRFPGDWRKPIGCSYWGAEQHQWGSISRWSPASDSGYANLEITPPRRFVRSEQANTEIFLPAGFFQENVTLKTYAGQPFPANLISTSAKGQVIKLRVRRNS